MYLIGLVLVNSNNWVLLPNSAIRSVIEDILSELFCVFWQIFFKQQINHIY